MYGFIYITENLVNGKKYLGLRTYKGRWQTYLGSGIHFTKALKKYGKENFKRTIIAEAEDRESLSNLELYYGQLYNVKDDPNWYNLSSGGLGRVGTPGFLGKKHKPESNAKRSQSLMGHPVTDKVRKAVAINGRKSITAFNNTKVMCPHCNTTGGQGPMRRWHFNNCKLKACS